MRLRIGDYTFGGGNRIKLKLSDWLLIIGFCLAPMTGLRVWKVGPAEVLCLLWGVRFLIRSSYKMTDLLKFFLGFISAMLVGSLIGYFFARNELNSSGIATWLYLAVIAISIEIGLSKNSVEYNDKLIFVLACSAIIWQFFLFEYSQLVSKTFFGADLWYHGVRYTGGATNPHQVAVLLSGTPFIFARRIKQHRNMLLSAVLIAASVFLLLETESSTGIMAVALGALVMIFLWISNLSNKRRRVQLMLITLFLIAITLLLTYSYVFEYLEKWLNEDSNGVGRLEIFSSFWKSFRRSPIFGLGPGVHASGGKIEFHNTYLEILASTGAVGMVFFVIYTIRCIKKLWEADWTLVPILVSLYAYSLAGFAMRRLAYWIILITATVLANGITKESGLPRQLNSYKYYREESPDV